MYGQGHNLGPFGNILSGAVSSPASSNALALSDFYASFYKLNSGIEETKPVLLQATNQGARPAGVDLQQLPVNEAAAFEALRAKISSVAGLTSGNMVMCPTAPVAAARQPGVPGLVDSWQGEHVATSGRTGGLAEIGKQSRENSIPTEGLCKTDSNAEDYYKDLERKVQRRLLQNREAARRCREKRQAYVKQLESQLELLKKKPIQEDAVATPSEEPEAVGASSYVRKQLQEAEQRIGLYKTWEDNYLRVAEELRTVVVNPDAPEAQLRELTNKCKAAFIEMFAVRSSAITNGQAMAVMVGGFFSPKYRMLSWLGGFRPSELLTVMQVLSRCTPDPLSISEQFTALLRHLQQEEAALSSNFGRVRFKLLNTAMEGTEQSFPQARDLAEAGNELKRVLLATEELKDRVFCELEKQLTLRQFACALLSPYELLNQVYQLSNVVAASQQI